MEEGVLSLKCTGKRKRLAAAGVHVYTDPHAGSGVA